MAGLAGGGITEYHGVAPPAGGAEPKGASNGTKRAGGFTDADRADLSRILGLFALHVERHIVSRIASNVLDTYLGEAAGKQVLRGSIKRGAGEAIRAIIWL